MIFIFWMRSNGWAGKGISLSLCLRKVSTWRRRSKNIQKSEDMRSIVWRGIRYKSWKHCKIQKGTAGFFVNSEITQTIRGRYRVCATDWKLMGPGVSASSISAPMLKVWKKVRGSKSGEAWLIDNTVETEFCGLQYFDISVTPFTNTLSINNLLLEIEESTEISFFVLMWSIITLTQWNSDKPEKQKINIFMKILIQTFQP